MRRQYAGGAKETTLTVAVGASNADRTINGTDFSNYPDGSVGPFYIVVDRGTAAEEKMLCESRSGNIITVLDNGVANGRGADGTTAIAHSVGATVEHVFTATDADEANSHVNASSGVHGVLGSVVGTTDTQTLTGKTISGASNTLSNIPQSAVTDLADTISSLASDYAPLNLSINPQTGTTYTLVLADASKQVEMNNASANTLTVPPNSSVAFPVGTSLLVVQTGAGQTTIAAGSGVTINSTPGLKLRDRWSAATLVKRATDTWLLIGDTAS